jgi:hypothetical protein
VAAIDTGRQMRYRLVRVAAEPDKRTTRRLLAAHARLRGWRLATGDTTLLAGLGPRYALEL